MLEIVGLEISRPIREYTWQKITVVAEAARIALAVVLGVAPALSFVEYSELA